MGIHFSPPHSTLFLVQDRKAVADWFYFFRPVLKLWFSSNFPAGLELSHGVLETWHDRQWLRCFTDFLFVVCTMRCEDLEVMTYSIAGMSREDGWTLGPSHVRCWPSCKGQGQGALHLSTLPLPWSNQSTEMKYFWISFEKFYSVLWFTLTKPQEPFWCNCEGYIFED